MFSGQSSLRSDEPKAPRLVNKELQDYLAKYTNSGAVDKHKKKKKKKPKAVYAGVKVVDNDVSGFAANIAGDDDEDEDDSAHFCHPAPDACTSHIEQVQQDADTHGVPHFGSPCACVMMPGQNNDAWPAWCCRRC